MAILDNYRNTGELSPQQIKSLRYIAEAQIEHALRSVESGRSNRAIADYHWFMSESDDPHSSDFYFSIAGLDKARYLDYVQETVKQRGLLQQKELF